MVVSDSVETKDTKAQSVIERRNLLLKDVDPAIVRNAWFTLSHLLLGEGAQVVDMGCDDGAMTYAMAAMHPKVRFTGLDKSKRQINKAKEKYKLFNLDFKVGSPSSELFEKESLDAIVNSFVLHKIYSGERYVEQIVRDTLEKQFRMLKKDGIMFIRDYSSPPPEEFVLMEMLDIEGRGKDLAGLSEADLLVWYAEHARPRQDAGCGGFFLEELPERYPGTRLFRLPYKWAYEFILRKDDRKHWETQLPMEYTFFTIQDFRKELRSLGARVQYSAPYWDEDIINERFEGRFRLYHDDGTPMGYPPTCFVAVSYKMAERKSLNIEERRPSSLAGESTLKITTMRDKNTGALTDVVSREASIGEVLPYRIDSGGSLKVYLHDGRARSIANAVPRDGVNIDGRRWSAHMVEPIAVGMEALSSMEMFDLKHSALFARDHLGLKPKSGAILEHGPDYYPDPGYIDEKIHTYYLEVQKARGPIAPKDEAAFSKRFQARGFVREIDAQQVLNAITVGMIPNARLELQILSLFQHLNMAPETWTDKVLNLKINALVKPADASQILQRMSEPDERFTSVKGSAGQLRNIHSIFVEEGQSQGAVTGLSAEDVDFVVHDDRTLNTAVILPLTKDLKGTVHAGFNVTYLPVPQRYEGNGLSVTVPSLTIPADIVNQKQIKKFIADEYGIPVTSVFKMGESYFTHLGLTPQRIHPYAIASPPEMLKDPDSHFLPFYQLMLLQRLLAKQPHFMTVIARAYRYFHEDLHLDAKAKVSAILKQRFENLQPDWSLPLQYDTMDFLRERLDEKLHDKPLEKEVKPAPEKDKKPAQPKHDEHLSFHHRQAEEERRQAEIAEAEKAETLESGQKASAEERFKPDKNKHLTADFEAELEEFMEQFKDELEAKPEPEKW